ncbi:MAG: arginine repressor [Clostridia bacterium]|nr:arginine repressor [Clostridia bacterium]
MDKQKRQQILLDIVTKVEVDTQEEIIKLLNEQGLNVTQATVSRDIKEMGLVKTSGRVKKYKYAQVTQIHKDSAKLLNLFKAAVNSIDQAQNLVVVKTIIGNANAVAAAIDAQRIPGVIGTLAGDDTVLVVTKDNDDANFVIEELNFLL